MSNELSIGFMTTGIIAGVATIYAYKKGYTVESIMEKLELDQTKFNEILTSIIDLGKELIEKIYLMIKKFIEEFIFKARLKWDQKKSI